MRWSSYQESIFDAVASDDGGDLVVSARAGSAKTTSIVESLSYVPPRESVLVTAFNKEIQRTLAEQVPDGVEARTFHSYGLRTVDKALGGVKIDGKKIRKLAKDLWGNDPELRPEVVTGLAKTVSMCKHLLTGSTPDEVSDTIYNMHINTGIASSVMFRTDTEANRWYSESRDRFVIRAHELLWKSKDIATNDKVIDFDDMVWLPEALDLKPYVYDRVFVDEAQDINPAQVALIERGISNNGRLTYVGDRFQQIYGWRGATAEAMQSLDAPIMKLPVCYRCARSIVELAQELVSDIEPWEDAVEGEAHLLSYGDPAENYETAVDMVQPEDVVLSRTNAPLFRMCLRLIRDGKPARILGRPLGEMLKTIVKRSKARTTDELIEYQERQASYEINRLKQEGKDFSHVEDLTECIRYLSQAAASIDKVKQIIDEMFTENTGKPRILLSTVHRFKGQEAPRVYLLLSTFRWRPGQEEANIVYVATTRAKRSLVLVGEPADWERSYLGQIPQRRLG